MIAPFLPLQRRTATGGTASYRLYSPAALALYAWLANLPMAIALLGINLRRRGRLLLGTVAIGVSVLSFLLYAAAFVISPGRPPDIRLFGYFGGLLIYGLERPAFVAAVARGAVKARWWPPLLILLGVMLCTAIVAAVVR